MPGLVNAQGHVTTALDTIVNTRRISSVWIEGHRLTVGEGTN